MATIRYACAVGRWPRIPDNRDSRSPSSRSEKFNAPHRATYVPTPGTAAATALWIRRPIHVVVVWSVRDGAWAAAGLLVPQPRLTATAAPPRAPPGPSRAPSVARSCSAIPRYRNCHVAAAQLRPDELAHHATENCQCPRKGGAYVALPADAILTEVVERSTQGSRGAREIGAVTVLVDTM